MSKMWRIVLAVVWGLLAGAAGLLMLILIGLHGAFSGGGPLVTPQFVVLAALFLVLVAACVGQIWAAIGEDTATKAKTAVLGAVLPLVGLATLVAAILLGRNG